MTPHHVDRAFLDATASLHGREAVSVPEIDALIAQDAVVAVGVSGGKDSQAVAIAVDRKLRQAGHRGPRVLVHADLGRVEWQDSMTVCERLADHLGWELMVVRRPAGDMLDRWESRWASRSLAYVELETVRLTLPWATAGMRFCTSELKIDPISRALRKRFPTGPILSVDGVRAQESAARAKEGCRVAGPPNRHGVNALRPRRPPAPRAPRPHCATPRWVYRDSDPRRRPPPQEHDP